MSETRDGSGSAAGPDRPEDLIAIVDDDASVRRSMRRLVRALGFRAEAFASAEDFLAAGPASTTCLLLDVRMPGMDGLALQRHLRADGRQVAILFLAALATEEEEQRARQDGAVDFLRKPVARDRLLRALEAALATSRREGREPS